MGLEPTTFGSEVRRAIHYATEPSCKPAPVSHFSSTADTIDLTLIQVN
jgi:hypothetical protein